MDTWPADARVFSRPSTLQGKSPGNEVAFFAPLLRGKGSIDEQFWRWSTVASIQQLSIKITHWTFTMEVACGKLYIDLYNSPSYSRILIGSLRRSTIGQMHDWRHPHKVFLSALMAESFEKSDNILRDWLKKKYKNVLSRHWTGTRSKKK